MKDCAAYDLPLLQAQDAGSGAHTIKSRPSGSGSPWSNPMPTDDGSPAWVKCRLCDCYWCTIHKTHAYNCDCPPIEEWEVDPYTEGGPE